MKKRIGRLLICLLALSLLAPLLPHARAAGTGAIPVSTVAELIALDGKEGDYYLTADLDLSGLDWTPIELLGSLDGRNHTVSGLTIRSCKEGVTRYGLFSSVFCGSSDAYQRIWVKNLNLTNVLIDLAPGEPESWKVGALCGYAYQATIENVRCSGSVSLRYAGNGAVAAGLCGEASSWYVRFFDCVNECTVRTWGAESASGVCTGKPQVMTACRNDGAVEARPSEAGGPSRIRASGLAASAGVMMDCENNGAVSALSNVDMAIAGGLLTDGDSSCLIRCRNTAAVSASVECEERDSSAWAGGLAADLRGNGAAMLFCENTGAVTASNENGSKYYPGETLAGGLCGKAEIDSFHSNGFELRIVNCRNTGDVTAHEVTTRSYAIAGGICGCVFVNGPHVVVIEDTLNTGSVLATTEGCHIYVDDVEYENAAAGGVVGACSSSQVSGEPEDLVIRHCAVTSPRVESTLDKYLVIGEDYSSSVASWISPYGQREENLAVLREDPDAKYEDDENLTVLTEEELRTAEPYTDMGWDLRLIWHMTEAFPAPDLTPAPGALTMSCTLRTWADAGNLYMNAVLRNSTGRERRGSLWLAAYDEKGRLIAVEETAGVEASFDPREAKEFLPDIYTNFDHEPIAMIRVFFLSEDWRPLAGADLAFRPAAAPDMLA